MNVAVIFGNIGPYHAARLRHAHRQFQKAGGGVQAIQAVSGTDQHPWGDATREAAFPVVTLLEGAGDHLRARPDEWMTAAAAALPAYLERLRPDAVAIPGWGFPLSQAALSWCRRRGRTAVVMSESKWDDDRRRWWKEALKSRLYVRRFDAALVGGQLHKDYLVRLGFPRERIFTGYDAVDNDHFSAGADAARSDPAAARARRPHIPARPYFICATRLIARKNVLRLVAAYADYRREVGPAEAWDLVVCGSGEEESGVREAISSEGLEGCAHLPGFLAYEELGDWYGLAAAFIHPAVQEQWGLVVNEACAAALPVLCSRTVGASRELVSDGRSGFLFDPSDTREMTRRMVEVHRLGDGRRRAMGEAGRRLVSEFGPQRFAAGLSGAVETARALRH